MKPVDALTVEDLRQHSIWQYVHGRLGGEITVRPFKARPLSNLTGKLVGTEVSLANGASVWALIGNVDAANLRVTTHFIAISLEREGRWFHLARYHDFDVAERGPQQLAAFLGLRVEDVFPIAYDLLAYAKGDPRALKGSVPVKPDEVLTRDQIIALAVPRP